MTIHASHDVLLLIDLQPDFMPGGALAVPGGDEVVPLANELAKRFRHVVLTQDWHPAGHISFASMHPGSKPFEQVAVAYGQQTLWPDHCLTGTAGAALHPALEVPHAELILRKGFRREIDSYSAFMENDHCTPTGLAGYLHERGIHRLFLAGLAYDYCVRYSAEDGAKLGFECVVIEDACRAIDAGSTATNESFATLGVRRITSAAL